MPGNSKSTVGSFELTVSTVYGDFQKVQERFSVNVYNKIPSGPSLIMDQRVKKDLKYKNSG